MEINLKEFKEMNEIFTNSIEVNKTYFVSIFTHTNRIKNQKKK